MNILKTAFLQSKADLRVTYASPSAIFTLIIPLIFIGIGRMLLNDASPEKHGEIIGVIVSAIASFAALTIFNLYSECYTERISGNFVRIRTLPKGVNAWMLAKVLVQEFSFLLMMVLWVGLMVALLPDAGIRVSTMAALVALSMVGVFAFAPYGLMIGMAVRSIQGFFVVMIMSTLLWGLTGGFYPITTLPTWAGVLTTLSPFYWMGYTARALTLGTAGAEYELFGVLSLPLGLGVVVLWGVVGWLVGPRVVRAMMRKETIGQLTKQRDAYRTVSGL